MHENKFLDWYNNRFSNGYAVASHFNFEISNDAAAIGVDWSAIKDIPWKSGTAGKINATGSKLLKGFKNSVGIYASLERDKNGVEYPLITFKNKGGDGDTIVFNGLSCLWELYKQEKDEYVPQSKLDEWDRKKREREELATRQREAALVKHEAEAKRRAANVEKELQEFSQLPSAASFVYTDKKLIPSILNHIDARSGSDKHGNYLAFKLQYLDGKAAGIQRIYDRKITKGDGSKTNKDFTWGLNKDEAHLIIGDVTTAERIYVVEGFATGASVFLAMQQINISCAVIVAMDAGNMVKVVNAYQKKMPYLQLLLAADNDMWKQRQGKGNKGMMVAMELLAAHDEIKAYAPNFDKVDAVYQATDWNDLHVRAGLKEVTRQLKGNIARVKCSGDLFEKSLQLLNYISFKAVMDQGAKCVQTGMAIGLPKYRPSDVVSIIINTATAAGIPRDHINAKKLAKKATGIFKAKVREAQAFRSFSPRITRDDLRPDHISYKKFNKSIVDDEVLDYVKSLDGIVIVRFPMGSRKTQGIIKPIMWQEDRSAFFAHRVSLIGGAEEALNKNMPGNLAPIGHYQDKSINEILYTTNKLACCINSCLKPTFAPLLNNLDAICFDEAAQNLRHVTAGSAIKYPVAVFNKMLSMMATTKHQVILADADANDTLVDFCELGLKQRIAHLEELYGENAPAQKVHVIDGHTDCSDTKIYYTDSDTAFKKASDDVGAGEKVMIANDSANDGEKLFTHLQTVYPDKKGLFISLDTKESPLVEAFTDNPNEQSKLYDYLIYSPSISSGVSIENQHFTKHYGIFCGTVAPSDAIQMIRRDRAAREFVLGLSTMHSNREESASAMWLGMLLANDNQLDIELNHETGKIELTTQDLQFDRFRLDLISQENKAKNNFANNLLCILHADGYQLNNLDTSEIDQEIGKEAKSAAKEMIKAIDMARHLDQKTPTDQERQSLTEKFNMNRDEKAQLNRWDIENALMMKVNEDSVDFHHNGGLSKVKLFELLNMSPEQAHKFDMAEKESGIQPSNRMYLVKQRQALRDFFELAGFDWATRKGQATEESLTAAINHLISGDNIHLFNNWYKFGGYVNPFSRNLKPVNKAKSIMEALGLKLDTTTLGRYNSESLKRQRYSINESAWAHMAGIQSRRVAARTTAFKVDSLDVGMIQTSSDTYIDNENEMDHDKTQQPQASSWLSIFNNALENLGIPISHGQKVSKELCKVNIYRGDYPKLKHGELQNYILNILQRVKGLKSV